jgi:hypothetical protein
MKVNTKAALAVYLGIALVLVSSCAANLRAEDSDRKIIAAGIRKMCEKPGRCLLFSLPALVLLTLTS